MPTNGKVVERGTASQGVLIKEPTATLERRAFVQGLFDELREQTVRYLTLNKQSLEIQGRLAIVERNLRATREHLYAVMDNTDEEVPPDWKKTLRQVRFVGVRLGDACLIILKEHKRMSTQDLLKQLNNGQFRFRTGTPLREVNAALLRQALVIKEDGIWVYRE